MVSHRTGVSPSLDLPRLVNPRLGEPGVLDANGMTTQIPADLKRSDGKATVVLPADAIYLVLM